MKLSSLVQRTLQLLPGLMGSTTGPGIALEDRAQHVQTATTIGIVVGLLFSVFNIVTEGMLLLGLTEMAAVLFLVVPAAVISRKPGSVRLAETLLLQASLLIFGALIVFGGVEGTGLLWVSTVPFLAFFLKGQNLGWRYSLAFMALAAVYLLLLAPTLPFIHQYSPVVTLHFLLSLGFYTLVAASFNHVRSRFERQLQQGKEQAEAAHLAKSRFLAAASHDLRQPAHALGMFVARLSQLPNNPATRELVLGVDASVRALQDMLDAFFDYSRLDAKTMQVSVREFPIQQVFDQLRHSFVGMAASKGLRLRIRPSALWVHSDPVLLHRILLNLVSNAMQHTRQGSILVACRPTSMPNSLRIEVRDSGTGIAPEHHEKVFEEFFQVGNHERDRSKGLGLGLSIVERSCRLLNHPLAMQSDLGCGTRFTLTVPKAQPALHALVAEHGHSQPASELDGLHILVIEDDALGGEALQGLLQTWGCRVSVADQAQTACALMKDAPPDVIVSDYRLRGDHNGIDAIQMLRALHGRSIPACVISGDTDAQLRTQTLDAGLVLLQKPVRPAKLRSVLRHAAKNQLHSAPDSGSPASPV
ncbi:MAG: hypothetical protein RL459_854 [Pseudomonadota bacterium]|jgi:signal transduction histidine kinase/ActR/RegA family two-component response regulator